VAITFEPHPLRVLTDNRFPPLITLTAQKKELIACTELDVLLLIPFTRSFADIPAEVFVKDLLVERIGMKAIVIGPDYAFGKGRTGDVRLLEKMGASLNFEVVISDWINASRAEEDRISSTRIRNLVMEGAVEIARRLLGRHYQIRGLVVRGRNRGGKLLGFPTANLQIHDELCPKTGIYAVKVDCGGLLHQGVANIGYSPTFDDHQFTVEVHLLDFKGDLYGQQIKVNFIRRIRDEIKFHSLEALSAQIRADITVAREIIQANGLPGR
jgi:riboflavin kinase/FMN adenylyltransferase